MSAGRRPLDRGPDSRTSHVPRAGDAPRASNRRCGRCGRRGRRGRCGFAGIFAITLLLIVAATLAAVASAFAADARRTRTIAADAQLRQLLTAGAIAAAEALKTGGPPAHAKVIALPAGLASEGAVLELSTAARDGETVTVSVVATLPPRVAGQTLCFTRRGDRWSLPAADMN